MPALNRISPQARAILRRRGLLVGIWPDRLAGASPGLLQFINRFYQVAGFEYVVRDYFGGTYRRATAQLAARLAHRQASQQADFARHMAFERQLGFTPDGYPVYAMVLIWRGTRYIIVPWSRLHPMAFRSLFTRTMSLFSRPDRVRWVFDRRLGMTQRDIIGQVRAILADGLPPRANYPNFQHWFNALDSIIMIS